MTSAALSWSNICYVAIDLPDITEPQVQLVQTVLWVVLALGCLCAFGTRLFKLADRIIDRLHHGASMKVGLLEVGEAPAAIRSGRSAAVTGEGGLGIPIEASLREKLVEGTDPDFVDEEIYLLHSAARVSTPSGRQRFQVRIWLEGYSEPHVDSILQVTYRLHHSFPTRLVATRDRHQAFELWLNVWGEFTVTAYVERRDAQPLWISRYLDLPGRPED